MAHPRPGNNGAFQESQPFIDYKFDIFEWHPHMLSCVRYFLDHSQYSSPVQALAAFLNIQLPFQKTGRPVYASNSPQSPPSYMGAGPSHMPSYHAPFGMPSQQAPASLSHTSLVPYIRRLVVTGFDHPGVLHGLFGDDWAAGVGPLHETERRNFMFACKSDNWLRVKTCYDMDDGQTVPFLRPLRDVSEKEIQSAEASWSEWLAMQDWMLGPRAPAGAAATQGNNGYGRFNIKQEQE